MSPENRASSSSGDTFSGHLCRTSGARRFSLKLPTALHPSTRKARVPGTPAAVG